jgi:hypothetical protein
MTIPKDEKIPNMKCPFLKMTQKVTPRWLTTKQRRKPRNNPNRSQSRRSQNQKNCWNRIQSNISNGQMNMPKN